MTKFIQKFNLSLLLFMPLISFAFSGGSGTQQDPYLLRTCPELQSMIGFPSAHFQLSDNINCNGFDYGDGGGFMPIGSFTYSFIGSLDGNNFTISYLNINRPTKNEVGLIAYMDSPGVIKNLTITNSNIVGAGYTGGIVGTARTNATLTNNSFQGEVLGTGYVGGVAGSFGGTISNTHSNANVTGTSTRIGGLVGNTSSTHISNSSAIGVVKSTASNGSDIGGLVGYFYATSSTIFDKNFANCTVTGDSHVGGLIGSAANYAQIKNSFSTSVVTGDEAVGGLIGNIGQGSVTDNYAQGDVVGDHYVGGLIGRTSSTVVTNNYSATKVNGAIYAGGLIGYGTNTTTNSFWDRDVSGQPYSAGGTAKTTQEMFQQFTYVNWNFANIWGINEAIDYPHLQWEKK